MTGTCGRFSGWARVRDGEVGGIQEVAEAWVQLDLQKVSGCRGWWLLGNVACDMGPFNMAAPREPIGWSSCWSQHPLQGLSEATVGSLWSRALCFLSALWLCAVRILAMARSEGLGSVTETSPLAPASFVPPAPSISIQIYPCFSFPTLYFTPKLGAPARAVADQS